ncbi:MAG: TetR family transcriptional regulator [Gemmatimonadaceae bacterium]|nr:TetR family transcriptional regulator [Gemmatimonadaceae bacterium]
MPSDAGNPGDPESGKPLRADALRNRQRLIDTARSAFATHGVAASLEDIARNAGVGIGTLYRHFPTRDALIEEVYRSATTRLAESAVELSECHAPDEALRQWLLLFIDHLTTKKLMASALQSLVGGPGELYAKSTNQIVRSITMLMKRAEDAGVLRAAMDPLDLLRAIAGVSSNTPDSQWGVSARRLVDILIAGMRVS